MFPRAVSAATLPNAQGIYGDGSDLSPTFDGIATVLGVAPTGGTTYTMNRDWFLLNPTVNAGIIIITNGFRFFASGNCTNNGTIQWNGANGAANGTGGAATASGTSSISTNNIGTGGGTGNPTNGNTGTTGTVFGGGGGAGGHGASTNVGGTGGTRNTFNSTFSPPRAVPIASLVQLIQGAATPALTSIGAATGGGGGGGDGAVAGGGGGAGGGLCLVIARTILGTGNIQARGGNGGTPASGNAGGGGGGGGGVVIVISQSVSSGAVTGQTVDANGGGAGTHTGAAPATDGTPGNAGLVVMLPH